MCGSQAEWIPHAACCSPCAYPQVQLLLGRLPTPALIAAHGLQQYEPIIAAMRRCCCGRFIAV